MKLIIRVSGKGTTNPPPGERNYLRPTGVRIYAKPDPGNSFSHWNGNFPQSGSRSSPVIIYVDGNKYVTACFKEMMKLTIKVDGEGTTEPTPGNYYYESSTQISVSAIPASGWRFEKWLGDVPNPESKTVTIKLDRNHPKINITACYTKIPVIKYVINHNTREIHKSNCYWVGKIYPSHREDVNYDLEIVYDWIRNKGYNGCYWCLRRYDTDSQTLPVVLKNLESDLNQ